MIIYTLKCRKMNSFVSVPTVFIHVLCVSISFDLQYISENCTNRVQIITQAVNDFNQIYYFYTPVLN